MNENKEFINNNRKQFEELGRLIRQIDTVQGVTRLQDINGRQQAIRIIREWIDTLWGVDIQNIKPEEDDDLIRIIN